MIGQYLRQLWLTLSTPRYYINVFRESFKQTIFFFVISCIWLGLSQSLYFTTNTIPKWQASIDQTVSDVTTNYPNQLKIRWDQERLSLEPAQLLPIQYPPQLNVDKSLFPPVLAYISPVEITPADFNQLPTSSLAVFTPTQLFMSDQQTWNQLPLRDLPGFESSFQITSDTLPSYLIPAQDMATNLVQAIGWLTLLMLPASNLISGLASGLLNAILVYYLLRLSGIRLKYLTVTKLSLHVVVAALVIDQLLQWIYPNLAWPLFTLSYWLYMAVIVYTIRRQAELQRLQQLIGKK